MPREAPRRGHIIGTESGDGRALGPGPHAELRLGFWRGAAPGMVESPRIAGRAAPLLGKQDGTQESRQSHLKRFTQSQQLVKCSFSIILLLRELHNNDTDKYSRTLATKTGSLVPLLAGLRTLTPGLPEADGGEART